MAEEFQEREQKPSHTYKHTLSKENPKEREKKSRYMRVCNEKKLEYTTSTIHTA